MIHFLDLQSATDELKVDLDAAYRRFMDSGCYVLGEEVAAFEREYADYCEAEYCVGVGTGLDALVLALRSIDVGPGDEVIVPSNTYIATWLAVTQVGATIVPVEPSPLTHNIDPNRVSDAVTDRTKVILAVNLYGQPIDYDSIREIAAVRRIKFVTDNAQAHGARYCGRRVGALADVECHSFYPSKNLGAFGEAGAITTNDEAIAERVRMLRNYGSKVRYENEICGVNSRIDALQATFLRVKLRHLDSWNDRRCKIANNYLGSLQQLATERATPIDETAHTARLFSLPYVPAWADPVWHLFVIRVSPRDKVRQRLLDLGVETQIHYPIPPHCSQAYQHLGLDSQDFPVALEMAKQVLSLPMGPHMNQESIRTVVEALAGSTAWSDARVI